MENSVLSNSTTSTTTTTINSRSTAIKTILLAAWRVKLSDEEWENRIRKILPRGVNGDVYDLADCLLKQALVGPVPNQLFISYLKHAVNTQLVSHSAVLSSIAQQSTTHLRSSSSSLNNSNNNTTQYSTITSQNQQQQQTQPNNANNSGVLQPLLSQQQQQQIPPPPNRTSPIICLLEFLKSFRDKISCKGTEIECLNLCHSLSQLTYWLLKCILHSVESITGNLNCSSNLASNNTNNNNLTTANATNTNINLSGYQTMNYTNVISQNLNNNNGNNNSGNNLQGSGGGTMQSLSINNSSLGQYESIIGIISLCTEAIHYFINRPFLKSLLFISKIEYCNEFDEILQIVQLIQQKFANNSNLQIIQDRIQFFNALQLLNTTFSSKDMHPSVVASKQIRCIQQHRTKSTQISSENNFEKKLFDQTTSPIIRDSTTNYAIFNSLYSLIACDVILRPARSHKLLAKQLAIVTNFNSAPIHITYCELIRVCMIGFLDSFGTPAKVNWAFFTFLKMPKLLIELSKISQSMNLNNSNKLSSKSSTSTNFINDLSLAFERLCEYSPLLDEAEHKCKCDFFKCIMKELMKNDSNIAQELKNLDIRRISSKRVVNTNYDNNNPGVGGNMLLKTEPILTTILHTLDSTINQDLDELFDMISQLVSGIQFEFTLSAAASTGILQLFVKKLIEHNELNKISKNEFAKSSLVFDITFLILTYISQKYGAEVVDYNNQKRTATTTFKKWFHDCFNASTRINCPEEVIKNSNPEIVKNLIEQLLRSDDNGRGLQLKSVNWQEVCMNIPKAISEILNAWYQGHLNDDDIKIVFEHTKSKMCFVAVITATWLQAHIRTLNESNKPKLLDMLFSLTKASQKAKQQKQSESGKSDHYSERSSLMCSIIRKIYFDLAPKTTDSSSISFSFNSSLSTTTTSNSDTTSSNNNNNSDESSPFDESSYQSTNDKFVSTLTAQEIFLSNVKQCLSRGWIDNKSLSSMNSLFKMIGSECWTNLIVEQILTSHESPSDLSRAVNITYGLFHLDIEACAFALLTDTIPSWLVGEKKQILLNQPRAFALANLTVMTIIEVYTNLKQSIMESKKHNSSDQQKKFQLPMNGLKQEHGSGLSATSNKVLGNNMNPDCQNYGPKELKRIKLSCNQQDIEQVASTNSAQILDDLTDRFNKFKDCISVLMRLFKQIMSDSVMSQRTLFPVLFLQQTVVCTRENSSIITAHLQPEILLDIINLFSSELTFELVLAISNLSNTNSRKYAAKAMCQLAQVKESKQHNQKSETTSTSSQMTSSINQQQINTSGSVTTGSISTNKTLITGATSMVIG